MEHRHKVYHPNYSDPNDPDTFLNDFSMNYEDYYTDNIVSNLHNENYFMAKGDYFLMTVTNKNLTFAGKIRELVLGGSLPKEVICVRYGGLIRFENY